MSTLSQSSSTKPEHDQVAALAYQFYVQNGRQDGTAEANWLRAEQELAHRHQNKAAQAMTGQEFHAPIPPGKNQPPLNEHGQHNAATDRETVRQHTVHPAARRNP